MWTPSPAQPPACSVSEELHSREISRGTRGGRRLPISQTKPPSKFSISTIRGEVEAFKQAVADTTASDVDALKHQTASHASVIYSDSKSAVGMAYDPVAFKKTKHIIRAAESLRDLVAPWSG